MSTAELVMDTRIVWDKLSLKQIDEAKSQYRKYRAEGYEIVSTEGKPIERFNPMQEEIVVRAKKIFKKVLKILSEKGDERIVWDRDNGREAKEAKGKFQEFLKKGYKAYSVDNKGNKNRRIEEFDVDAEEILMIPPTAKG